MTLKPHILLPGFGLSLGFTLAYLCRIVLIPFSGSFLKTATTALGELFRTVTAPRVSGLLPADLRRLIPLIIRHKIQRSKTDTLKRRV